LKIYNYLDKANECFKVAVNLYSFNYLNDKKILFAIIRNLYDSGLSSISLFYEKIYKEKDISIYEGNLDFMEYIDKNIVIVNKLKSILEKHRVSTVEFFRNDNLVICSENYSDLELIDNKKLMQYFKSVKLLLEAANVRGI